MWAAAYCRQRNMEAMPDLADWWIELLTSFGQEFDDWAEMVFPLWGEHEFSTVIEELLDGEAEYVLDTIYSDFVALLTRSDVLSKLSFMRQKRARLLAEQTAAPRPHRPVRRGRRRHGDLHHFLHQWSQQGRFRVTVLSFDTAVSVHYGDLDHNAEAWRELRKCYSLGLIAATVLGLEVLAHHTTQGGLLISEHPAPPLAEECPTIWRIPLTQLLRQHPEVRLSVIGQWEWHAPAVKPTGLLSLRVPFLVPSMRSVGGLATEKPTVLTVGKGPGGSFKTAGLKEYPTKLSEGLARALSDQLQRDARTGFLRECAALRDLPDLKTGSSKQHRLARCTAPLPDGCRTIKARIFLCISVALFGKFFPEG
eukprot:s2127_g10.t1